MIISILSDFHFGYGWKTELREDSFDSAKEAIEKSLDSDLIILAGDIFDNPLPRTDVWYKSIQILSLPLIEGKSNVKFVKSIGGKNLKKISSRLFQGIPVVAIHGTHERRAKGFKNPIEALEEAGLLIHLHTNGIMVEKDDTRLAIQGMSGVPERYAKDVLMKWNPKPVDGCFNILLFHQSISPYVYSKLDPPSLSLDDLPKGFDLIVDGHIHTRQLKKLNDGYFLIPGSTIITQLKKEESETPKGFYKIVVEGEKLKHITFVELENVRKFYYREIEVKKTDVVRDKVKEEVEKILSKEHKKPPIVRIFLKGDYEILEKEMRELERMYEGKALLKILKHVEDKEIRSKMETIQKLKDRKMSVEEIGLSILKENLKDLKFENILDPHYLFNLLSEEDVEKVVEILVSEQKTLLPVLKKSLLQQEEAKQEEKKEDAKDTPKGWDRWVKK
ncbi:MAG: metallophosphoesterase family protein [Candidatus Aenigmarchaeota archaeon]|nr:metallophosphoesterase family protein [Candidatus Aenigmarchaeota archaeon]